MTHLKLPSVRKLHIFRWLLLHCKNWLEHLKDHDLQLYFPKLGELEERNLKRHKIEPVQPRFVTNSLPDKVVDVLCEVFQKVVFVTCAQPYMCEEREIAFQSDFVDTIIGMVRVCAPTEEQCEASVSVSMSVDRFFWHLHECLTPLAKDSSFFVHECQVREDVHKTTSGSKSLQLFGKMSQLTTQWNNNILHMMSVVEAQVGYEGALLFAEADTPKQGFETELLDAVTNAVDDKLVLQARMKELHAEMLQTKVSFAKSNVAWVKKAAALPNRGKNRKPPKHKFRRP